MLVIYIDGADIEDYISQGWQVTFLRYYHGGKSCFIGSMGEVVRA